MDAIRRSLRDDTGIAMVTVLGVLAFVTILAVFTFTLGQQALTESGNTQRQSMAFQVANAGLDAALANVQFNGLPTSGSQVITGGLDGLGSYTVTLTPQPMSECVAVSRGVSLDGAAEIIQTKFFYLNLWEFSIGSGSMTAGGGGVQGNGNIYGPLYVAGSIQLGGGANIEKGPLFVRTGGVGGIILQGTSHVGTPTEKLRLFCDGVYPPDAGDAQTKGGHYSYVSSSVPKINLPPLDMVYMQYVYNKAKAESYDNKMGPGATATTPNSEATANDPATYTTIDPGGSPVGVRAKAPNASTYYKVIGAATGPTSVWSGPWPSTRTPVLTLGGATSFGKWDYPNPLDASSSVRVNDDFAYDGATKTLYINGTVYVDGDVLFTGGPVNYVGNGTIVANGDITVRCAVRPKSGFTASKAGEAIGLVTPGKIFLDINPPNGNPKDLSEYPDFAGALFGQEQVAFTTNQQVRGSVLSKELYFSANNVHLFMNDALPTYLPDSLPGRGMAYIMKGNISRP